MRKSISETENALSSLLALSSQSIERGALDSQSFPDNLSAGVPLQLLSKRPDVRQAEFELAQAFYATNVARAAFYPSVNLAGAAGWTNNGGGIVLNPGQWLLNAIGSLTQPLFNRGTNIANLKIAKARQEEAALLFQNTRHNTPLPRSWRRIVIQSATKLAKYPHSVERQTSFGYSVNNRT